MLAGMSIGKKLALGFGAILSSVLLLSLFSLTAVNSLRNELVELGERTTRKVDLVASIKTGVSDIRAEMRAMLLAAALKHPQDLDKARDGAAKVFVKLNGDAKEIRSLISTDKGRAVIDDVIAALPAWRESVEEMARLAADGQIDAADSVRITRQRPLADRISKDAVELLALLQGMVKESSEQAKAQAARNFILILVLVGLAALAGVLVGFTVAAINRRLRATSQELFESARQVAGAAWQVSQSSQSLAQDASEQAAAIEETSASSEEIKSQVQRNAKNTGAALEMVTHCDARFDEANTRLQEMVATISEINNSSEKISKIIRVIDEIAFQTNILALNAAVEAARAGEAGMGFAVVADEVRSLAERSAQAARDTTGLISESVARASDGNRKVTEVATAIRQVTDEARQIQVLVSDVNQASNQQSRGIEQVAKAISQMEQTTQRAAAGAEEGAAAAEQLTAQSDALKATVARLASMVGYAVAEQAEARHQPHARRR